MKKIVIILFVIFVVFTVPFSCDPTNSGYGSSSYRIDSLSLEVVKMTKLSEYPYYKYDLFGSSGYLATDTVSSDVFGLKIAIAEQTYVMNNNSFSSPFIHSAFADPVPPSPISNIALISIYSDSEVFANGVKYEIGENLVNLFMARGDDFSEPQSVLKFVDQLSNWYYWYAIFLEMHASLDQPIDQKFQVKVTLEDGTVFEMETPRVMIK